ncbi:MAG: methylmalonyl Co-A mutase-associated GTPase MeaB, partial [Armatimonadetes bacterium]|nr:methylmalonyl Co-A mutase-associated GTPase MeaB [Armatimonadota bacterium]
GAGKSSLINYLALLAYQKGLKVGVIAVDPSSPFTGGALLGDRIRMNEIVNNPEIFVRSMATRGSLGGLAKTTYEAGLILDALGKEIIFIETVGVGQSELDIINTVDTVAVVLVPESGDEFQALKAGLMEIAHILVINKADREGGDNLKRKLEEIIAFQNQALWEIPVLLTSALKKEGLAQLLEMILKHKDYLIKNNLLEEIRKKQIENRLKSLLMENLEKKLLEETQNKFDYKNLILEILKGKIDPYNAAKKLAEKLFFGY